MWIIHPITGTVSLFNCSWPLLISAIPNTTRVCSPHVCGPFVCTGLVFNRANTGVWCFGAHLNTHRLTFRRSCGTNALCSTFYIRTSVSGQKCCSSLSVFQIANLAHQRALCSVFALILLLEWNLLFGSAQLLLLLFLRSITVGLLFFLCCLAFICTEAQFHRHFAGCLSNTSTLHRPTSSLFGNAGSGGQYFFLTGCH